MWINILNLEFSFRLSSYDTLSLHPRQALLPQISQVNVLSGMHPFHNESMLFSVLTFLQLCKAIQHIHEMNICHRDITPSNILLSAQYVVQQASESY